MKPVKLIILSLFMIAAVISEAQDLMYLRGQKQLPENMGNESK